MSSPPERRGRRRFERLLLIVALTVAVISAREAAFARNRPFAPPVPPGSTDDVL